VCDVPHRAAVTPITIRPIVATRPRERTERPNLLAFARRKISGFLRTALPSLRVCRLSVPAAPYVSFRQLRTSWRRGH
jgi:hypothetical protein